MKKKRRYVQLDRIEDGRIKGTEYDERPKGMKRLMRMEVATLEDGKHLVRIGRRKQLTLYDGEKERTYRIEAEGVGEDPPVLFVEE